MIRFEHMARIRRGHTVARGAAAGGVTSEYERSFSAGGDEPPH